MNRFTDLPYDAKAKGIFVTCLIACGAAFLFLLWNGTIAVIEKKNQIAQNRSLVERAAQLNSDVGNTQRLNGLFEGENTAVIQSLLQNQVKAVGDPYRIAIDSMEPLNISQEGSLMRVEFRMSGALPEKNIGPFLTALSTSQPAVIVTDMDLRPALVRTARIQTDEQGTQRLSVQLTLNAFAKVSPGSQ